MSSTCPRCGAGNQAETPEGLCPACLLTEVTRNTAVADSVVPEPRFESGDLFGPYRIHRLIGRGGMGEVYEADHTNLGRRVALKVPHRSLRRAERDRFLTEGRRAAAIDHPNSVFVFEASEIGGVPVLAMELLSGGTLGDRIRETGPMAAAGAVHAILQILDALEAAHAAGIVHCDVKPSNCFVDRNGTVKIGDYGFSTSTNGRQGAPGSQRATVACTPEFAAPELKCGEVPDALADIYSVGATLHFLLSGRPPGPDQDLRLPDTVPASLVAAVRRCLSEHAADRPGSSAELKDILRRFASDALTPAPFGLRLTATVFDVLIMLPVVALALGSFLGSQHFHDRPMIALSLLGLFTAYWTIFEGLFGAAYGKYRCGIQVETVQGEPPGLLRGFVRTVLFVSPIGWLFGWHDVLTSTRVTRLGTVRRRPDGVSPPPDMSASDAHIGPYVVTTRVGLTDGGEIMRGQDRQLGRPIWIHVLSPGAPPVPDIVRNTSRPGGLHWIRGRRADEVAWDAYEAPSGQPLLSLPEPSSWRAVSLWLRDLAEELMAREVERSTATLSLDRVWITGDGRGKLLNFRAPGLPEERTPAGAFPAAQAQQFLSAAARHASASPRAPLPVGASALVRKLEDGEFSSLRAVIDELSRLRLRPDEVTAVARGMTLTLACVAYFFTSRVGLVTCMAAVLASAYAFRSGALLRAFGIAVVGPDGREASRLRAVGRAALTWSWIPAHLAAITFHWPVAPVSLLTLGAILYAADHPTRGIQDRLAGTCLVPR